MIVGEVPGEREMLKGEPFVGYSGEELSRMLHEAGIMRSECFMTNVARTRPFANDIGQFVAMRKKDITPRHTRMRDKFVTPEIVEGVSLLRKELTMCKPNVVVACGNLALWALTGQWGVTNWRGSVMLSDLEGVPQVKVVPIVHPAMILRQWSARPFAVHDLRRVRKESAFPELRTLAYNFIVRPTFARVVEVLTDLFQRVALVSTRLSIDIETRAGHTACIGLAWSRTDALCIPLMCVEDSRGYWGLEEEAAIMHKLWQLLTHPNCRGIGQNFSYDLQYFHRHHLFMPRLVHDTMISQHTMFSNQPKGLDVLSSLYCEHHRYWKDDGKLWDASMSEDQLWSYNCEDCCRTFEIAEGQEKAVNDIGVREVHDFQQRLLHPVVETMNRGIRFDTQRRDQLAMELQEKLAERTAKVEKILGHPINLDSPQQLKTFFYDQCKVKPVLNRKTRQPSTDDEALRTIASREPVLKGLCNLISEYRSLRVFFSTFISARLDVDGRMRSSFNVGGTDTFRFSSSTNAFGSGLNLQNIPSGDEDSALGLPNVRKLFIPDPGMEFFDIDLASADLRIVVWESDEPEMKSMLRAGLDPYTEVAKEFYHDPSITKKDPRRQKFKSFCHGTNYLGSPKGLAERLGLSVAEAERTQRWYFSRFPRIKAWQDDLKARVVSDRCVSNIFGYKFHIFDRIEGTLFNEIAAWIPQSTVACLINRAYVNIYDNLKEVEILLQVHDSLAGQYPTHLSDWCQARILQEAAIELPYADPLIIPVGIKTSTKSWGDCE